MRLIIQLLGLALVIFGIYMLGQNIIFTTNPHPYFWRGIAADGSILALIAGLVMLVYLPRSQKNLGWIPLVIGIVLVFLSSNAVLTATTLWQFVVSFASITIGYQMLTTGRILF